MAAYRRAVQTASLLLCLAAMGLVVVAALAKAPSPRPVPLMMPNSILRPVGGNVSWWQESGLSLVALMWCHELVDALRGPQTKGKRNDEIGGGLVNPRMNRLTWSTLTVVVFVLFRKWHAGGDLKIGHEVTIHSLPKMCLYTCGIAWCQAVPSVRSSAQWRTQWRLRPECRGSSVSFTSMLTMQGS